ncbi:MAG: LysM peptidoglycan-binding domain-containing protein [Treponema sp.]|nr:LysM peptidoglycan-binding domain-containing protein [Treponema sp.]
MAGILSSGTLAAEELIHVVGKGDTVYSLSRFYHVTADELMNANGITDPSKINVGKRLIIPVSAESSVLPGSTASVSPSVSVNTQTLVSYMAVRGDTLYSIARNNGITLQRLQEINGFSSNHVLKVGDLIKVPGRSTPSGTQNNSSAANTSAAGTTPSRTQPPRTAPSGIYALRWPITPKEISYMTGQMGVVVEGEQLESVRSLTQGNVVSAGPWRKFGRVVIVETQGGYYYMYGGCETITVNVGDRITPGMELGKLGINAVSVKPQLFFMVFRNDNPMDPALAPRAGNIPVNNQRT